MKVFIAILALVGAAAANHIPQHAVPVEKAAQRGIANIESTEAMTPAQRGIANIESLGAMTPAERGIANVESLGAMTPAQRGIANVESLGAMTPAQRGIANVESLGAMTAAQRGIANIESLGAMTPAQRGIANIESLEAMTAAQRGIANIESLGAMTPAQRGIANIESLGAMTAAQRGIANIESLGRTLSVFGAAKTVRDSYLPLEKTDILSLYEKPMVLALKSAEMNAVEAYVLKDGLSAVFNNPAYSSIRGRMLSGPAKVGLLLSATRLINTPEMAMPLLSVKMSPESTLNTISELTAKDVVQFPWMTITEASNIRGFNLESLEEVARYTMLPEKLSIDRSFPIAASAPLAVKAVREWPSTGISAGVRRFPASLESAYESERLIPAGYVAIRNAFPTRPYNVVPSALEGYVSDERDEVLSGLSAANAFPYVQRAPNAPLRIHQYPVGLTNTPLTAAGYSALPVVNIY